MRCDTRKAQPSPAKGASLSSEKNKRFRRRTTWVALGVAVTAFALATVSAALSGNDSTRHDSAWAGYRGWRRRRDASHAGAQRRLGTLVTALHLHDVPQRPAEPDEHRRRDLGPATGPHFNRFGAAYRDVLFQQVAPAYRSRPRRIYDVPLRLKKAAAQWPSLRASDSDGDGYSNEVELMFGSKPGRRKSYPSRPAAQLERWRAIIVQELRGKQVAQLELDPRVRRVGPDSDGDCVPDALERFVGTDPRNRTSTPLVAARRLALYRQLLLDAGVSIR